MRCKGIQNSNRCQPEKLELKTGTKQYGLLDKICAANGHQGFKVFQDLQNSQRGIFYTSLGINAGKHWRNYGIVIWF